MRTTALERFKSFVLVVNECWEWQGATINSGYASFSIKGKTVVAHRWAYENLVAPIPTGLYIDHLCRNRKCVNPAHLEPVTARENVLRSPIAIPAINALKTHCKHGHFFSRNNTYMQGNRRKCKRCRYNNHLNFVQRKKLAIV